MMNSFHHTLLSHFGSRESIVEPNTKASISFTEPNNTEPNLIVGKNEGCLLVGQLFPFLLYFYVTNFSKKFRIWAKKFFKKFLKIF